MSIAENRRPKEYASFSRHVPGVAFHFSVVERLLNPRSTDSNKPSGWTLVRGSGEYVRRINDRDFRGIRTQTRPNWLP
jgi:hypothetical protein